MYQVHCHDCDAKDVRDELSDAQALFNEHAALQHEVIMRRIESTIDERGPAAEAEPDAASDAAESDP